MLAWPDGTPQDLAAELDTSLSAGLSFSQARERLALHGPNQLPEAAPTSWWAIIARQFSSLIALLLGASALLAWGLGQGEEAIAIGAALLLNAVVGTWMDSRAARAIEGLSRLAAPRARAWRSGTLQDLEASQVVPGDLLEIEAGDRIPADGLLVQGELSVDESLLSGESLSVAKAADAAIRAERRLRGGTTVAVGHGRMLVAATGLNSEIGRIGVLLSSGATPEPLLNRRLAALGRYLLAIVAVASGLILALGLWQGRQAGPLLETVVILAIAAIPEGLPTVATLSLARGASRLARSGLRLRSLSALESLGAVTILCLDKTGTLTANAMTVRWLRVDHREATLSGQGWNPEGALEGDPGAQALARELLTIAALASEATLESHGEGWHVHGDPSDGAILVAAHKAGVAPGRDTARRVLQSPDAAHPWMSAEIARPDATLQVIKGAPEALLEQCGRQLGAKGTVPLDASERRYWIDANRELAQAGARVFAVARRHPGEPDWEWLGLLGMQDPARPAARSALASAHRAGIRTVMITGDQVETARAIAAELDLAAGGPLGAVAGATGLDPSRSIYARATPEGKHALVQALQRAGEVAVMTGDGVNDAPALRAAAVGIAMGHGTEVARQAAQAVLLNEDLSAILVGIAEGRAAFSNIQRAVDYLLTCSVTTLLTVLLTTAAGAPAPLLPLQILYLNLLTHTLPALGLALDPPEADVLERPPRRRDAALLPFPRLFAMSWHALLMAIATLSMGAWGMAHLGLAHGRSLAFATLANALLLHTFADRSGRAFGGFARGGWLWAFVAADLSLQALALTWAPLSAALGLTGLEATDALGVGLASALTAGVIELSKRVFPPEVAE